MLGLDATDRQKFCKEGVKSYLELEDLVEVLDGDKLSNASERCVCHHGMFVRRYFFPLFSFLKTLHFITSSFSSALKNAYSSQRGLKP